jgi:hypothetical protein
MASQFFLADSNFHVNRRVLLHASNLPHGTDSLISSPKEGMLWIFSPEKCDGFGGVRTRDLGYQRPACICVCRYVRIVETLPFYCDVFTSSDYITSNVGRISEKLLEGMWKEVVVDGHDVSSP